MKHKRFSYEEFIDYRNKIVLRLHARNRVFTKSKQDKFKEQYYEIRLKQINEQYPEFSKFGQIKLKKDID